MNQHKQGRQSQQWLEIGAFLAFVVPILVFSAKFVHSKSAAKTDVELVAKRELDAVARAPVEHQPDIDGPFDDAGHKLADDRFADEPADAEEQVVDAIERPVVSEHSEINRREPIVADPPDEKQKDSPKQRVDRKPKKQPPLDPEVKRLMGRLGSAPLPAGKIEAAEKLKALRSRADPACEQLAALMVSSRNAAVRRAASEAIEKINPGIHELILPVSVRDLTVVDGEPLLSKCLRDMAELGTFARPAFPVIWNYAEEHPNDMLALTTLVAIAPDERPLFDLLRRKLLTTGSGGNLVDLLQLLSKMRDVDPKTFNKVVIELIGPKYPESIRIQAMKILPSIGMDSKLAIEQLRNAKVERQATVRDAASDALKKIEKRATK